MEFLGYLALYFITLGLLPISVFSILIYTQMDPYPGLIFIVCTIFLSNPLIIFALRKTFIRRIALERIEKKISLAKEFSKNKVINFPLLFSMGLIFPNVVILYFLASTKLNFVIAGIYSGLVSLAGVLIVFLITVGIISDNESITFRIGAILLGALIYIILKILKKNEKHHF